MRPVGVVLNVGRGSLDLNVAGRLADGFRAGLLIRCESRRCGGDRHGGSTRCQQWCDVLQFHSHDALLKALNYCVLLYGISVARHRCEFTEGR